MLLKEGIIFRLKLFFDEYAANYGIEMIFLYGSWGAGIPKEESDIDIAIVLSSEDIPEEREFELVNSLTLKLSDILKKEVNIIIIHSDFRKPMLYYNAIVKGIPLYIKDNNQYVKLKMRAIYEMEDYCRFGIDWQLEITRRNLMELKHV